jgi:hypothetical protein
MPFIHRQQSCYSAVCATPPFVFFFLSQQNAHGGKCYLGSGQFLEAQHASFLSSAERGILITLMKAFTCHQVRKNRKWRWLKHFIETAALLYDTPAPFLGKQSSWEIDRHGMLSFWFNTCLGVEILYFQTKEVFCRKFWFLMWSSCCNYRKPM